MLELHVWGFVIQKKKIAYVFYDNLNMKKAGGRIATPVSN